jgi:hypothetical protein
MVMAASTVLGATATVAIASMTLGQDISGGQ